MIYTVPNIIGEEVCQELITYYEANPEKRRPISEQHQKLFHGKDLNPFDIDDPNLKQALEVIKQRLTVMIAKHYHIKEVYLDYWDIVRWDEQDFMPMHADNCQDDLTPHDYCAWRSHSAILYLNQDFEGGETIFRDMNQNYRAETGKALIFPATYDYTHGVNAVQSGKRYTLAFWFTESPAHCIKGWE